MYYTHSNCPGDLLAGIGDDDTNIGTQGEYHTTKIQKAIHDVLSNIDKNENKPVVEDGQSSQKLAFFSIQDDSVSNSTKQASITFPFHTPPYTKKGMKKSSGDLLGSRNRSTKMIDSSKKTTDQSSCNSKLIPNGENRNTKIIDSSKKTTDQLSCNKLRCTENKIHSPTKQHSPIKTVVDKVTEPPRNRESDPRVLRFLQEEDETHGGNIPESIDTSHHDSVVAIQRSNRLPSYKKLKNRDTITYDPSDKVPAQRNNYRPSPRSKRKRKIDDAGTCSSPEMVSVVKLKSDWYKCSHSNKCGRNTTFPSCSPFSYKCIKYDSMLNPIVLLEKLNLTDFANVVKDNESVTHNVIVDG